MAGQRQRRECRAAEPGSATWSRTAEYRTHVTLMTVSDWRNDSADKWCYSLLHSKAVVFSKQRQPPTTRLQGLDGIPVQPGGGASESRQQRALFCQHMLLMLLLDLVGSVERMAPYRVAMCVCRCR